MGGGVIRVVDQHERSLEDSPFEQPRGRTEDIGERTKLLCEYYG
jgi:hypothetical protein